MINARTSKRTDFQKLPYLEWGSDIGWYDALAIVPLRKKHDSGWAHIGIAGVTYGEHGGVRGEWAEHLLAAPDDIHWPAFSGTHPGSSYGALRTDAYWPSGVLRLWSSDYQFSIDTPVSSVDILIRPKANRE